MFQNNIPDWISLRPKVNTDWSSWLQTLEGHTAWVNSVTFSPDGKTIASASYDNTVRVWSAATGDCLQTLKGHIIRVNSVAFSPDGKAVASALYNNTVRVWSATTGDCLQTLKGHTAWVNSVSFLPDGKTIASASYDNTVWVWSAATGDCLQTLKGHTAWVNPVTFSPDGKTVASASYDNTVRVWSADEGNCLQSIDLGIDLGIASSMLSFDPDGQSLLTDTGAIPLSHPLQPPLISTLDKAESSSSSSVRISPDYDHNQERRLGYGISRDCSWITLNGKDLLWLPADCRPGKSAVFGTTIVIGTRSGRVVVMRFSAEGPAGL